MKKPTAVIYNDKVQKELETLVCALKLLDKDQQTGYRNVLGLALFHFLPLEDLRRRLAGTDLPESTANEILTIYEFYDLAQPCAIEKLTVREALRQARERRHGKIATTTEEERLIRAAHKVLVLCPPGKLWPVRGKTWTLDFTPESAPAAALAEKADTKVTVDRDTEPKAESHSLTVFLPPAEAHQLEQYIDSPVFSAGQLAGELARRVIQPGLLASVIALEEEHQARARQLAPIENHLEEILP